MKSPLITWIFWGVCGCSCRWISLRLSTMNCQCRLLQTDCSISSDSKQQSNKIGKPFLDGDYAIEWCNEAKWLQMNGLLKQDKDYMIK